VHNSILLRISCSQLESLSQVQKISHELSCWWAEPSAASPSYLDDQQRTCSSAHCRSPLSDATRTDSIKGSLVIIWRLILVVQHPSHTVRHSLCLCCSRVRAIFQMAGLGEGFLRMDASYLEILLRHLAEEEDRQFYIVRTAGSIYSAEEGHSTNES
jgi:hypothetical protein